jgi:hypothetical protein
MTEFLYQQEEQSRAEQSIVFFGELKQLMLLLGS